MTGEYHDDREGPRDVSPTHWQKSKVKDRRSSFSVATYMELQQSDRAGRGERDSSGAARASESYAEAAQRRARRLQAKLAGLDDGAEEGADDSSSPSSPIRPLRLAATPESDSATREAIEELQEQMAELRRLTEQILKNTSKPADVRVPDD